MNQTSNDFSDLQDEVGADDWIIPKEEISRRRLIKRTPRHNIYKADWFGDVLVYEPLKPQKVFKPNELSLKKLSKSNMSLNSIEQADSAYSSLSSTPQYYTKQESISEFEFPQSKQLSPVSISSEFSFASFNNSTTTTINKQSPSEELDWQAFLDSPEVQMKKTTQKVVILNKDSYKFGDELNKKRAEEESSWSELNELRLVAHESFMLFMGVSLDRETTSGTQFTSLVMQMNHPKATSLYNLLHATKFASSPIDRFFNSQRTNSVSLSVEVKLNICQQVTNAMTYLHDKNIVHGKLTSNNIYIEPNQRVKISLIDNDDKPIQDENKTHFNLPPLTYMSPELLINSIKIEADNKENKGAHFQTGTSQITKKSDIFSFGTLLFELFEGRFPFSSNDEEEGTLSSRLPEETWNGNIRISAHELISQISSGLIKSKNYFTVKCPTNIEETILACWFTEQRLRPTFRQLASIF